MLEVERGASKTTYELDCFRARRERHDPRRLQGFLIFRRLVCHAIESVVHSHTNPRLGMLREVSC